MVLSAAHPLLLCCGTWGGGSYSLWAMVSWSTSSNGDPPCWWESGQAVPGWPQGPCRGSPKPSPVLGPRAEVATAMGPLSLSILFPAASTLTGCCPLSAFSPPRPPPTPTSRRWGRKLVCRIHGWVPSTGEPSTKQAPDQCLCKECSLCLLDSRLSPSLSDSTLSSLRSLPYLAIPA